jgi:hypothetical protein
MARNALGPLGSYWRARVTEIPGVVADEEPLHRRIHPTFVRPDGSVSSQAFRDREMSVDRGLYWEVARSLHGYDGYGIASILADSARACDQEVVADSNLFNPAHALVRGEKSKSTARRLAGAATWVVSLGQG